MAHFIKAVSLFLLIPTTAFSGNSLVLSWLSLDEATKQVRQDSKKKVLGAKTESIEGHDVHIIKVLTPEGRIQYLKIDAETGRLVERDS